MELFPDGKSPLQVVARRRWITFVYLENAQTLKAILKLLGLGCHSFPQGNRLREIFARHGIMGQVDFQGSQASQDFYFLYRSSRREFLLNLQRCEVVRPDRTIVVGQDALGLS